MRPSVSVPSIPLPSPVERPRFLSEADCQDIAQRLARFVKGGGYTIISFASAWRGNVRWARNEISTTGEDRDSHVVINRDLFGAVNGDVEINEVTDAALVAAARRAERMAVQEPEREEYQLVTHEELESFTAPQLFFDATYQLEAEHRAEAACRLAQAAKDAGMLSAGYIEVSANSIALITSWGYTRYFRYTWAQYSVTVRDPKGIGSGWAGVDWPDWTRIDTEQLSAIALDKCLTSRNPVAVEPGRYMTILEPQAVCDFIGQLMISFEERKNDERDVQGGIFWKSPGYSRIGERVVDARITISADPMDPDLGFPPFAAQQFPVDPALTPRLDTPVYHPVTWIQDGVLTNLPYDREYGVRQMGRNAGLPNSGAFRMSVSGAMNSLKEMIASTKRGILVTRFDQVEYVGGAWLCRGYTRDGLWLVENGAISKPIKNFMFLESVLFALNNVEQLGVPQRTFHPPSGMDPWETPRPVIVPPLKIRDFSFTALSEAI